MKKYLILNIVILIIFCSCDSGLKIIEINLQEAPEKINYFVDSDSELDFSGGKIKYITKSGRMSTADLNEEIRSGTVEFNSNINFSVPGEYVVTLKRGSKSCSYKVYVID